MRWPILYAQIKLPLVLGNPIDANITYKFIIHRQWRHALFGARGPNLYIREL